MHRLSVAFNWPDVLYAVTSSSSKFLCCSYDTGKVHLVDCSTRPPISQEIPIESGAVSDMCTSGDLLVITSYDEGVFAYTLDGGELKWNVSGKLPGMQLDIDADGVTADEQGHLFVCDFNNECVHELSARDGTHLGMVVRKGQVGVGKPCNVTWHQESMSLVVAHSKDDVYCQLSVFCHRQ